METKVQLKTRHAFIDASVFINENFAVTSTAFKSLVSLASMGSIFIKVTDITLREVEAQLESMIEGAQKALNEKTRIIRVLRNDPNDTYRPLFEPINVAELKGNIWSVLRSDLEAADVEIIPAMNRPADEVFERYFQRLPPFGPAKKKEEFPDAFVVCALEKWCTDQGADLYVVSSDKDLQSACGGSSRMIHLGSVAELVDLVLRTDNNEADFLLKFFMDNSERIADALRERFGDRIITLEDEDGEGEVLSVDEVDLDAESIIQVSEGCVVLELSARVAFTASISYADQSSIYHDREDGTTIVWNYNHETVERSVTVPVEARIEYQTGGHLEYVVKEVAVNRDELISIYVDEDAETHWK